jgi:hypothetical protein
VIAENLAVPNSLKLKIAMGDFEYLAGVTRGNTAGIALEEPAVLHFDLRTK